jgi:hypothetical protein
LKPSPRADDARGEKRRKVYTILLGKNNNTFLLLAFVVLAMLTALMTPSCVETLLRPADDGEQLQALRKTCLDTLAKYHARYGDLPIEEWPSEGDQLTYTNAKRILAEMEKPSHDARDSSFGQPTPACTRSRR